MSGAMGIGVLGKYHQGASQHALPVSACGFTLDFKQTLAAFSDNRGRALQRSVKVGGIGAAARTVGEEVQFREADLAHHAASVFEVGIRFTRKADDHVRGESGLIERLANAATAFEIPR